MPLLLSRPIAFFDLETTGLTIGLDRIIEIAVVKVMPDGQREIFAQRINPEMAIPQLVTNLTGITNEMVKDMPVFAAIAQRLNEFLADCDLAGYNSNKFDVPFLVDEFLRVGVDFKFNERKLVDVQNIFHKMEQRTLAAAYKFYCEKELINAHSAEADILATVEILEAQLEKYREHIESNVEFLHKFTNMHNTVDLAGRLVYNEKGEEIINFGKHKGKKVQDVFASEPSYYDWLMKGDFSRQTKAVFKQLWESFNESKLKILQDKFNSK
jgi:DNA polymerase III subunit epsilon